MLGSTGCQVLSIIWHIIAYVEFLTLGFIAFFRCLGLLKLEFVESMAQSRIKITAIIAGIWLFVALLHLPAACFGVSYLFASNLRLDSFLSSLRTYLKVANTN